MPYAVGGLRDRKLRAGWVDQGLGGRLWLLTLPEPPPGKQYFPAYNDRQGERLRTRFATATRSQSEVTGTTIWLLTTPDANLTTSRYYFPDATYTNRFRESYADVDQPGAQQNLLLSPPAVQAPLTFTDWPNPVRRSVAGQYLVDQSGAQQNLLLSPSVIQAPLIVLDWPNPVRRQLIVPNLTWLDSTVRLIGQDRIYDGPGKVPSYDWPNPRTLYWPPHLRGWSDSTVRLIGQDRIYDGPGKVPTYDWPNPRIPQWSQELRTWLQVGYNTALNPPAIVGTPISLYAFLQMSDSLAVGLDTVSGLTAELGMADSLGGTLETR